MHGSIYAVLYGWLSALVLHARPDLDVHSKAYRTWLGESLYLVIPRIALLGATVRSFGSGSVLDIVLAYLLAKYSMKWALEHFP